MTLIDLIEHFPDEISCKKHLRFVRENAGICCKKCNSYDQYWLQNKQQWQCKKCTFRTTLKSGTLFQNSKMPLRTWFIVMGYMTLTKKGFSAKELQNQVNYKFYEPIWYMMHKIRKYMAKTNDRLEFLFMEKGRETISLKTTRHGSGRVERTKMVSIFTTRNHHHKGERIPCVRLKKYSKIANQKRLKKQNLSHPNYPIHNFEKLIIGIHHQIGEKYLQNYLDEFSFKFNRRYSNQSAYNTLEFSAVRPFW